MRKSRILNENQGQNLRERTKSQLNLNKNTIIKLNLRGRKLRITQRIEE
jgi:hypothetical protein